MNLAQLAMLGGRPRGMRGGGGISKPGMMNNDMGMRRPPTMGIQPPGGGLRDDGGGFHDMLMRKPPGMGIGPPPGGLRDDMPAQQMPAASLGDAQFGGPQSGGNSDTAYRGGGVNLPVQAMSAGGPDQLASGGSGFLQSLMGSGALGGTRGGPGMGSGMANTQQGMGGGPNDRLQQLMQAMQARGPMSRI